MFGDSTPVYEVSTLHFCQERAYLCSKEFLLDCSTPKRFIMILASNFFKFISSADPFGIGVITLLLIALFFIAWKAPAWVKETGLVALATGWLWTVCEFMAMGKAIAESAPDVDSYIIWGAVPIGLIPAAYGIIVYIISLIIRIVRKPKM